ncbi:MAG: M28 family peptidase [Xanthomonadaceae bacterium]|jgi:Zn-dependent M28 family amino/carboxypeptidase|nr:M28 family peptidase [Xanthomonadaceae bacterium]
MLRKPLLCLGVVALLSACNGEAPAPGSTRAPTAATTVTAPNAPVSTHSFSPEINAADFSELVRTLASDEFEGRGPGTAGEEKAVDYIRAQMQRTGLQPGNGDSYFQEVPMVETIVDPATAVQLQSNGQALPMAFGNDFVIGTRSGQAEVKIDNSELVFVGYGVDAPERRWNDYGDQDWTGKTVVMFVNDPGFHTDDKKLFDGKRMTYYGRWTYKFEEAARKGAAAALIVHDTPGAAYDWDVVKASWSGPQYDLPLQDDPAPRLSAQGWITGDAARTLFHNAGLDLDEAYRMASRSDFKPVPLQATFSADLRSRISEKKSRNVIGVLPGASRADEAVVYMAHWDHLGKHEGQEGDNIYNGAIDNASGVAGILEIADAFAHQERHPQRSVVFLAVTLEESGLLGSQYYVAHPTFPLEKIAGVVNIDALSNAGSTRDLTVVGLGSSELEDLLNPLVEAQGRMVHGEDAPQNGIFFRSDHFSFAKAGVPALYAGSGSDLVEGGREAGKRASEEAARHYHQPSDEFDPAIWKLDGILEDLQLLYGVGKELAAGSGWPNWYEGNEFKAARDRSRAAAPSAQ